MEGRRYDIPPKNRRALEQRLRNVIADTELQQRARRQLGYVALAATLMRHARDEHNEPLFLIKGAYLIAQKLHACTDHIYPERPNDRYRDLIDLILVDRLMRNEDRTGVREVCVEIFRLRAKHAWPPRITVLPDWPEGYRTLAEQLGFVPADVHQAAIDVHEIIARIDTAHAVT